MRQQHFICVRGKQHQWSFNVEIDPKHVPEIREDGIEVYKIENSIPAWIVTIGLLRPWIFLQDCFHFRWPFEKPSTRG